MTFAEFVGLPYDEQQKMFDAHYAEHKDAIDSILLDAGWALFVEGSAEPVHKGALRDFPTDEQLMAWGNELGKPIYIHSAPSIPESMALGIEGGKAVDNGL